MTRGPWTTAERKLVAACAAGAVAIALLTPLVWHWLLDGSRVHATVAGWVIAVLAQIPACLALTAVVLTARALVGTPIAVVSGVVAVSGNLVPFRSLIGPGDYATFVLWAALLGCALAVADAMAWRLGEFTMRTGVLAGLLVGVLQTLVRLSMYGLGTEPLALFVRSVDFWVRDDVVPGLMLVGVGALAGAVAQRRDVPQEMVGSA